MKETDIGKKLLCRVGDKVAEVRLLQIGQNPPPFNAKGKVTGEPTPAYLVEAINDKTGAVVPNKPFWAALDQLEVAE